MIQRLFHDFLGIIEFRGFTAGMGDDDFVEFLIRLRIAHDTGKRRKARAGGETIKPLARHQCIMHQRTGRLLAEQNLVARLNRLQARRQRAVSDLDRIEFELLIPAWAGNGICAKQWTAVIFIEPDHHELA